MRFGCVLQFVKQVRVDSLRWARAGGVGMGLTQTLTAILVELGFGRVSNVSHTYEKKKYILVVINLILMARLFG